MAVSPHSRKCIHCFIDSFDAEAFPTDTNKIMWQTTFPFPARGNETTCVFQHLHLTCLHQQNRIFCCPRPFVQFQASQLWLDWIKGVSLFRQLETWFYFRGRPYVELIQASWFSPYSRLGKSSPHKRRENGGNMWRFPRKGNTTTTASFASNLFCCLTPPSQPRKRCVSRRAWLLWSLPICATGAWG